MTFQEETPLGNGSLAAHRFVAQHVAKALQGEQIICLEVSWRTMPAILMTQSRRLLTNQGDVTTSCLRKSLWRGRRGLWQVDRIKGLGTSPLSFLLVFPFRYNLKECTCPSVSTVACVLWLG